MPENGQTSRVKLPIAQMAKDSLEHIFPQLTAEQCAALRGGLPVPPSQAWLDALPLGEPILDVVKATPSDRDRLAREADILNACIVGLKTGWPVTCVMPFGDARRIKLARRAVNQFVAQSYPHKKLVVVNASGTPVTTVPHADIAEVTVAADTAVWEMRNVGIDQAGQSAVFPFWDDDDVYDPHLLSLLMSRFGQAWRAVALSHQVRVDIQRAAAYVHYAPTGLGTTVVVPPDKDRFSAGVASAEEYMAEFWPTAHVIDTSRYPLDTLKVAVYHGNNATPREEFMVGHAGDDSTGVFKLSSPEAAHLAAVLATFGLKAEPATPSPERP